MATPNIVPRADGEGSIGTSLKKWAKGYFNALFINNVKVLPDTVPIASSIPIADANGKIDSEWIKDASETVKGVVELATPAEVLAGVDTERAVTPAGFKVAVDDLLNIADLVWGSISGTLSNQTDLQAALNGKANTSHSHSYAPIPTSSSLPVGVWCLCYNKTTSDIANGETIAGSNLKIFGLRLISSTGSSAEPIEGGSLPGTWKNITGTTVGKYRTTSDGGDTTTYRNCGLFVRIV